MVISPCLNRWQTTTNAHMYNTHLNVRSDCEMPHNFPASLFCCRETNCSSALALQWRMKVQRARQTSIPLQPPLSNKHIYYSSRARLEVSPHTPPNKLQSRAMRFRMHYAGNFNQNGRKKKENKWPSHWLFVQRKWGPQQVFTYSKNESLHHMMFYDFLGRGAASFPISFFTTDKSMTSLPQGQSAPFNDSTVSSWLMEIWIHWPNTAIAFCFLLSVEIFFTSSFPPTGSSPGLNLILWCVSYQFSEKKRKNKTWHSSPSFFNHSNYCGANPDYCCHGNCLSGGYGAMKAQVRENERKLVGRIAKEKHTVHCVANIFHVPSCFMACIIGSLPWLGTIWPRCRSRVNARKWIWCGWVGISVSFSAQAECQEVPKQKRALYHLSAALNGCVGFKEGSGKHRGQHMSDNTYRERKVGS